MASVLCTLLLTIGSNAGIAENRHGHDHDRARQAVEAGEVLPLRTILERVERAYPGQVIDVELERESEYKDGPERWAYKIKLLRSGGNLIKLKVDARDGSIIGKKESDAHEHEQQRRRNGEGR